MSVDNSEFFRLTTNEIIPEYEIIDGRKDARIRFDKIKIIERDWASVENQEDLTNDLVALYVENKEILESNFDFN